MQNCTFRAKITFFCRCSIWRFLKIFRITFSQNSSRCLLLELIFRILDTPSTWLTIPNLTKTHIFLRKLLIWKILLVFLLQETNQTLRRSYLVINILLAGHKWSFSLNDITHIHLPSKISFSMQWLHTCSKILFYKNKNIFNHIWKQSHEAVLQTRYFSQNHRKTSVPDSLLNKMVSCEFCKNFAKTPNLWDLCEQLHLVLQIVRKKKPELLTRLLQTLENKSN